MTKPQWLIENERKKTAPVHILPRCCTCIYFGQVIGEVKHKKKERVLLHECDIHPGCYNTKYSYACADITE